MNSGECESEGPEVEDGEHSDGERLQKPEGGGRQTRCFFCVSGVVFWQHVTQKNRATIIALSEE